MKYIKFYLIILSFLVLMPQVSAKDISAKYEYISDDSVYTKKIMGSETNIAINDFSATIIDEDNKYRNATIKVIQASDTSQIKWLNGIIGNNEIKKAYYFIFENGNKQIDVDNIKIKTNISKDEKLYSINSKGTIIDSTLIDKHGITICNNGNIVIAKNSNFKTITLATSHGGSIILDGIIVNESGKYVFESNKIIIRPDYNYELSKALLNNIDIVSNISNGFLDATNIDEAELQLEFNLSNDVEQTNGYQFTGQVIYNNVPLANGYIELYSNKLTTFTNEFGYFSFDELSLGHHSMTIMKDNKVLGYTEFELFKNNKNDLEIRYKQNESIITNSDNVNIKFIVNDEYDLTIVNNDIIKNDTNSNKLIIIYSLIIFLTLLILILLISKLKNKNITKK